MLLRYACYFKRGYIVIKVLVSTFPCSPFQQLDCGSSWNDDHRPHDDNHFDRECVWEFMSKPRPQMMRKRMMFIGPPPLNHGFQGGMKKVTYNVRCLTICFYCMSFVCSHTMGPGPLFACLYVFQRVQLISNNAKVQSPIYIIHSSAAWYLPSLGRKTEWLVITLEYHNMHDRQKT